MNNKEINETITTKILENKTKYEGIKQNINGKQYKFNLKLKQGRGGGPNNYLKYGNDNLKEFKWFTFEIETDDNSSIEGYKNINLTLYRISSKDQKEASKVENIYFGGVSSAPLPNVDGNSGNIHQENLDYNYSDIKIKQLVLCNAAAKDAGPKLNEDDDKKNLKTHYKYEKGGNLCYVHKACYFPLIDNDEELKNNWRYDFLRNVAKKIYEYEDKDNPKILSKEIIEEINS